MKINYSKYLFVFVLFAFTNTLLGQSTRFFVGMGGFAKHSFPDGNVAEDSNILGYSNVRSTTLFLEPGYELSAGITIKNRFDVVLGINSTSGHLSSSPFYYELNFHQINFPLLFRYHFSSTDLHSDFLMLGVSFGKILQRELSRDRSTWQHSYLEDWNDVSPLSLEFGIGRSFAISEKSNLVLNPYLSYELSKNEILERFFNPFSIGLKVSYELNLIGKKQEAKQ